MKIYYNQYLKKYSRNLRNKSTLSEVLLWNELKGRKMCGYQFMRQKPIGNFIVDFFCSKLKLVLEVDGDSHNEKFDEDIQRQDYLEGLGLFVFRIDDLEVKKNMENVLVAIAFWIENFEQKNNVVREGQPPAATQSQRTPLY